ncbi:hypothetical protein EMPS_07146 [Entomortierella parvispora]|uniref:Uncharacterized protein n=1 Tax=Entomortierella parvispora TaxID=205924 RepID=A0A9P3HE14_9FUNG|nr:hypothetical protein EMPS_07146 [Entomortierella parvispora]
MMMKSFTSALLLVALVAVLASAQTPTPTATTVDATSTSITTGTASTTPAASRPASNYTGIPPGELSTLLGVIASYATGRSVNPGYGATSTPTSAAVATSALVSAPTSVLMGMGLVLCTIVLTAFGTVGF